MHSGFDKAWRTNGLDERILVKIKELMTSGAVDRDRCLVTITGTASKSWQPLPYVPIRTRLPFYLAFKRAPISDLSKTKVNWGQDREETAHVKFAASNMELMLNWDLARYPAEAFTECMMCSSWGIDSDLVAVHIEYMAHYRRTPAGHSLGSALANLAAYDICAISTEYGFQGRVTCTTFGGPRTGNHQFAREFNVSHMLSKWLGQMLSRDENRVSSHKSGPVTLD